MSVELTLTFTDAQAAALAPVVTAEATKLALNPDVIAKIGDSDVESWTTKQKAKLVIYCQLMFLRQRYARDEAELIYGEAAAQAAGDESPVEVD